MEKHHGSWKNGGKNDGNDGKSPLFMEKQWKKRWKNDGKSPLFMEKRWKITVHNGKTQLVLWPQFSVTLLVDQRVSGK